MTASFLLVLIFFISIQDSHQWNYFCGLSCGRRHTVCKLEPCGPSYNCGSFFKMLQLSDELREVILDFHNKKRLEIAITENKIPGVQGAANMRALSYSKELEFVAQCWANNCLFAHDACRTTPEFSRVGQNIYISMIITRNIIRTDDLKTAVDMWFSEIKFMNKDLIKSLEYGMVGKVGHFTQLVWAKTTHLGCGLTSFGEGNIYKLIIVCNYGPSGNMIKDSVFEIGAAASACGNLPKNQKYNGLCGNIRQLSEDTFNPPFKLRTSKLESTCWVLLILNVIILLIN